MNYYTYDSLLNKANNLYQTLLDMKQWGPHVISKDQGATPETLITIVETNALVLCAMAKFEKGNLDENCGKGDKRSQGSQGKSFGNVIPCIKCGKMGHRKSDCKSSYKKISWKKVQPKSREPTSESVDGTEYHWRGKCGCWSPTHGTADHKDDKTKTDTKLNETKEHATELYCQCSTEGSVAAVDSVSIYLYYI
jgi:Zinc knuckle